MELRNRSREVQFHALHTRFSDPKECQGLEIPIGPSRKINTIGGIFVILINALDFDESKKAWQVARK